jgi:hypothetical protein
MYRNNEIEDHREGELSRHLFTKTGNWLALVMCNFAGQVKIYLPNRTSVTHLGYVLAHNFLSIFLHAAFREFAFAWLRAV